MEFPAAAGFISKDQEREGKRVRLKRDHYVGIALAALGVVICAFTTQIKSRFAVDTSDVGPRLFPYIAGIGLLICGLLIFITTKRSEEDKAFLDRDGWKRLGALLGLLILYAFFLYLVGFLYATPVMLFLLILLLAGELKLNKVVVFIVSLVSSGLLYYLFHNVMYVMLPQGILL